MPTWLEAAAYAITRGIVRAYLDVLRDAQLATVEAPTDADRARADRFRAAVAGRLRNQVPGDPGRQDPAPDFQPHPAPGVGDHP